MEIEKVVSSESKDIVLSLVYEVYIYNTYINIYIVHNMLIDRIVLGLRLKVAHHTHLNAGEIGMV